MERNIYLFDRSETLKTQDRNDNKSHLNRRSAHILQNTVCKVLSKTFFDESDVLRKILSKLLLHLLLLCSLTGNLDQKQIKWLMSKIQI